MPFPRKLLLAGAVVFLIASAAHADPQTISQTATSWHPGDGITISAACISKAARLHVFEDATDEEILAYRTANICRVNPVPFAVGLVERLQGVALPNGKLASLWKVVDLLGVVIFVIIDDNTGPHPSRELRI